MVHVPDPPELVVRPVQQRIRWREWATLALLWFASLIVVAVVVWVLRERVPVSGADTLEHALSQNAELQRRVIVLERAEQVARTANTELQHQIEQQQTEISGLRGDLAFYARLNDSAAAHPGFAVQALELSAVSGTPRMYNFSITLTQNIKVGQTVEGRTRLGVSGTRGDRLATLAWSEVAQNEDASGMPFSFKYFEQIKGTLLLPEGFTPNRIHVDVDGHGNIGRTDRTFEWSQVLKNEDNHHAR